MVYDIIPNDVNIAFLLGFVRAMQYLSKFQKICYGAQRIYGISWEGYYMWMSNYGH
jgi:hypothetical protein